MNFYEIFSFLPISSRIHSHGLGKTFERTEVAVKAVHLVYLLCERVQESLLSKSNDLVQLKPDNSLVTVADWSVQAIMSWILSEAFGSENVSIAAEEDVQVLCKSDAAGLLDAVVQTANNSLAGVPCFGLRAPAMALSTSAGLDTIGRCNLAGGVRGRFWVLESVDGTVGFVRGDQYAIGLALIVNGEPVIGVLGCPSYPIEKEWLSYSSGYWRIISRLALPKSES